MDVIMKTFLEFLEAILGQKSYWKERIVTHTNK